MAECDKHQAHRDSNLIKRLLLNRYSISFLFLKGNGIEIGALHNPLRVAPWTRVSYVDRLTVDGLRDQYPELKDKKLVPVDIVDDGELLATVPDGSQDFVIANHFVEHCENPLLALENMLRVLRSGGVVFLALPDMRYSFDRDRQVTPLEHLQRDYREGPAWSRRAHFEEWVRLVNGVRDEPQVEREVEVLLAKGYSIHYHVWTQREMAELVRYLQERYPCDIELMLRNKGEVIFIIRKAAA
jgi:SAM-dependent methyltransferase